jgi:hypothetical protein
MYEESTTRQEGDEEGRVLPTQKTKERASSLEYKSSSLSVEISRSSSLSIYPTLDHISLLNLIYQYLFLIRHYKPPFEEIFPRIKMKAATIIAVLGLTTAAVAGPVKRDVEWTENYVQPEARAVEWTEKYVKPETRDVEWTEKYVKPEARSVEWTEKYVKPE